MLAVSLLVVILLPASNSRPGHPSPFVARAEVAGYSYGVHQGITSYVDLPRKTGNQLARSFCLSGSLKAEGHVPRQPSLSNAFISGCMRVYFSFFQRQSPPSVQKEGTWAFYEAAVTCGRSENLVWAAGHWTALGTRIMWSPAVNRRYGFVFGETLRVYSRSHAGSWILVPSVGMGMGSDGGNSSWNVEVQLKRPVAGPTLCRVSTSRAPTPVDWFG